MVDTELRDHLIHELNSATCAVPFEYLGMHHGEDGQGLVIRVWQPACETVEVLCGDAAVGPMERVADTDLFELRLPGCAEPFVYRLRIVNHGRSIERYDAYEFSEFAALPQESDHTRMYRSFGAHPLTYMLGAGRHVSGVRFAVYAPAARSVSVIGEFNDWDGRRNPMHSGTDGVWLLFVPDIGSDALYKFEIKDANEKLLPHKADPFSFYQEQAPANASIVYDPSRYEWHDRTWRDQHASDARADPIAIYEVHAGSWRRRDGAPLPYRALAKELIPYVRDMGFTHIELLPIAEHPFIGSWGYQPVGLFAPTSRFGSPDDFKAFVDECHQAGIGVILDWVPAHFPNDEHGLAFFDGTALYEHPDPRRGWHPDWNTHIYDYGRDYVRDFLISSAMFWLDEYHLDGLRVDAVASMLYLDYSRNEGEWVPNQLGGNENLEAIALIKELNEKLYGAYPGAITIAEESTSWPGVSRPVNEEGLGFGYKWNMGWMHDTLSFFGRDPVYRKYHHNEITFGLVYAFDEHFILPLSHDEVVHGKGSLLGKMAGDEWQSFANLRLYFAFMYGHPGKKLLFMGGELAQYREWDHDAELDWHLLNYDNHGGVQNLVKHLNRLYVQEPALHELDFSAEGFEWIDADDAEQGVLSFVRYARDRGQHIVVVSNVTPVVRHEYRIGVPAAGRYREILNTDSAHYAGSDVGNSGEVSTQPVAQHQRDQSLCLTLPPLATLYLKPV